MTVGFVAIARPTFDVAFASALAAAAVEALSATGLDVVGTADLAMSDADVSAMSKAWAGRPIEALVIVQASFADSTLVAAAADTTDAPIVLWGAPEPRTGHRLRRNSLCGINLAAFRLANDGRDYRYLYADPSDPGLAEMLDAALSNPLVRLGMSAPARVRSGPAGDRRPRPARAADLHEPVRIGGVKYTIKDGIVYDAKKLLADVRAIVAEARLEGIENLCPRAVAHRHHEREAEAALNERLSQYAKLQNRQHELERIVDAARRRPAFEIPVSRFASCRDAARDGAPQQDRQNHAGLLRGA